jgi:hypothetical protein
MIANLHLTTVLAMSALLAGCTINFTTPLPPPAEPATRVEMRRIVKLGAVGDSDELVLPTGCERQETMVADGPGASGEKHVFIMKCAHGGQTPSAALEALMSTRARVAGDTAMSADDRKIILDTLDGEIRRQSAGHAN